MPNNNKHYSNKTNGHLYHLWIQLSNNYLQLQQYNKSNSCSLNQKLSPTALLAQLIQVHNSITRGLILNFSVEILIILTSHHSYSVLMLCINKHHHKLNISIPLLFFKPRKAFSKAKVLQESSITNLLQIIPVKIWFPLTSLGRPRILLQRIAKIRKVITTPRFPK